MIRVAILAHSQVSLFELSCAVEVFALPRPEFESWYDADVINLENKAFTTTANIGLLTQHTTSLESYDILVIPSWPVEGIAIPDGIRQEISKFHCAGKRILSFCSGAFLLAELGILHQRQATTHWRYESAFRSKFPDISYCSNVLYVFDGQIGCSAGSAAALDLGLAVVRADYGYEVANQVAKRLVVSAHRDGGQSQFVDSPMLCVPNQFSYAVEWAQENLDKAIAIDTLAQKANMSRRTFDRKFRASFDLSPKDWLIRQRINRAKGLLESKNLSMDQLAERSGFDNAVTMRHHFRRLVGVSPTQYQTQFFSK
ncbi:helix-turn-helix domain-containing protein [Vibrio sonorensis]|uniref:helix-turn-helix domain-containing protein n=1 Tax=Vibrio sonorensis TaxID=1004316 RepID=UPI0008D9CA73|nr:helix-turn-helix domain-containing protein [Vibrio sonorensis]